MRHPRLELCGHRFDLVNEPRTGCEICWVNFFAYHPQLVETADQFFRTQGKAALIGMRGKKFVKYFTMYMATLYREQQEREANGNKDQERGTSGDGAQETGTDNLVGTSVEGGKAEGGRVTSDVNEQAV